MPYATARTVMTMANFRSPRLVRRFGTVSLKLKVIPPPEVGHLLCKWDECEKLEILE